MGKWTVSPSTMQNWPIPRSTFKLAPTILYSTLGLLCHPVVNQTLTRLVFFADVAKLCDVAR
ncbi:hypothetical protein Hanom_Chr01g00081671 [Helianthus anomalus]